MKFAYWVALFIAFTGMLHRWNGNTIDAIYALVLACFTMLLWIESKT